MSFDALTVEDPAGGPRVEPGEDDDGAGDRLEEEEPRVIGGHVVEVGDDTDVDPGLHDEACGQFLLQVPLLGIFSLRLRNDDGQLFGSHIS